MQKRLKALEINKATLIQEYNEFLKDWFIEFGGKYYIPASYDEAMKLNEKVEKKEIECEDRLFTAILNYTQFFFAIRDFLKEKLSNKEKKKVNVWFSNRKNRISSHLKHNPLFDLKRNFIHKTKAENIITYKFDKSFHYKGQNEKQINAYDLCLEIHEDLKKYLKDNYSQILV